ncbi:hypothetical protein PJL18_03932 [Paenarthrobacter nicotinovorans]|nr:hypothetical protein [Paenarthrobacter nicotinovorans]
MLRVSAACCDVVREGRELGGVGVVEEVDVQLRSLRDDACGGVAGGVGGLRCSGGDHACRAEHFAADIVAVERIEVRFGHSDGAIAVRDGHDGGIQQAARPRLGRYQGISDRVDFDRDGPGVEPVEGVEVVDEGFQEDRAWSNALRVADSGFGSGVPGEGAQQLRCAYGAVVHQLAGGCEIAGVTAVEAKPENDAGARRGIDGGVEFIDGPPAGLFAENILAG